MNKRLVMCLSYLLLFASIIPLAAQEIKKINAVNFSDVTINDRFWDIQQSKIANETLWACIDYTEHKTGRIRNFERVSGMLKDNKGHEGIYYDDSDVYKALEAIAYSLKNKPNISLEKKADDWINKIAKAQQADGYLNTYYTLKGLDKRWTDMEKHEDYCAGHLIEAGIAYFDATKKRKLLDVAIKMADHLVVTFGYSKKHWVVGHQGLELALVKLYKQTKNTKYLTLADWFLKERGHGHGKGAIWDNPNMGKAYTQDDVPLAEANKITGHAVRAMYYYTGAADVAALKKNSSYLKSMQNIWEDVAYRNMYITGAIGSSGHNEGFTKPYDLPNAEAYGETCASVGMVFWNSRMFELTGDSKYYDVLERSLYNGCLSGISLSGKQFFYPNPLASNGATRKEWFGTACCPSNIARLIASVGNYIYAYEKDKIWINLYIGSNTTIIANNQKTALTQTGSYLEDGKVEININPEKETSFELLLRLPGWATQASTPGNLYTAENFSPTATTLQINGKPFSYQIKNGYILINRKWKKNDKVILQFPLQILKMKANDLVEADKDRIAIQRGPFVYCLEEADNEGKPWEISSSATFTVQHQPDFLNGTTSIWIINQNDKLKAIPYYLWANRSKGKMEVWMKKGK